MPALVAFVVALLSALLLTPIVRDRALSAGLVDEPGGRKAHVQPVPRLGGLAIAAATAIGLAVALAFGGVVPDLPGTLLGLAILMAVGIVDDVRDVPAPVKLLAHVAAAAAFVLAGAVTAGGLAAVEWLPALVAMAWIVAVINALNLIDGLDGLASGVTLAALAAFAAIASLIGADVVLAVAAALGGAVLGFLRYNLSPATVMMGDTGAMILGYLAAIIGLVLVRSDPPIAPWVPILVLAVPLTDMVLAVVRRALQRRSLFSPDSGHVHHRLLRAGLSPRAVMLAMTAVGAAAGGVAVVAVAAGWGA